MTAAEVAARLDGRREGRVWRYRCPLHGGHSLVVSDGRAGLLATCWSGCDRLAVLAELRRLGLDGASPSQPAAEDKRVRRIIGARRLWDTARDARRSPVVTNLRSRGISIPPPATLRWLASCPHPSGVRVPAMVARVGERGPQLLGVHRTFLRPDGTGKATVEPVKASLGPIGGGCVRLAPARSDDWLIVGKGIGSAASAMRISGSPAWAALSTSGLLRLALPPEIHRIIIAADNDANGAGEIAARTAGQRWLAEGRMAELWLPRALDTDFNFIVSTGNLDG
jgi:putative DNA primase/helicase